MKKGIFRLFAIWICLLHFSKAQAQVYIEYGNGAYNLDICACQVGGTLNNAAIDSHCMAADTNGNVYYMDLAGIMVIEAATGNTHFVADLPPDFLPVSMVCGADGLIYTSAPGLNDSPNETLIAVNPVTGAIVILGELPAGFGLQGDLFFHNGLLYGLALDAVGTSVMLKIPVNNPGGATVLHTFLNLIGMVGGISIFVNGVPMVFVLGFDFTVNTGGIYQIDMATGGDTLFCHGDTGSDLAAPPNLQLNCCSNNAGNFASLEMRLVCENDSVALDHLGDAVLNPGATMAFVLVDDSLAYLPDGLVQISTEPRFGFDPATMSLDSIYFVAAVVAIGSPGDPDWVNGCVDLSFFAPVQWRPLPTVALAGSPPEICTNGCAEFALEFTGAFPVELDWQVDLDSQVLSGTLTATGPNDTLVVCPPGGVFPPGTFSLNFLEIADAVCACP